MRRTFLSVTLMLCSLLSISIASAFDEAGTLEFKMRFFGKPRSFNMTLNLGSEHYHMNNTNCVWTKLGMTYYYEVTCTYLDCLPPSVCDHPFVSEPDDWDDPVISNLISTSHTVSNVSMTVATWIEPETINIISPTSATIIIPGNGSVSLYGLVETTRVTAAAAAIHSACDGVTSCKIENQFSNLPYMVREAIRDAGQLGLAKYAGSYASPSQHGCDDFYGWFAYNEGDHCAFREYIHYNCDPGQDFEAGDEYCMLPATDVCIAPDLDAFPSEWVSGYGHGPNYGYLQEGMLYKLSFNLSRTAVVTNGDGLAQFELLDSNPEYWSDDLKDIPLDGSGETASAESGDVLWRWDNCPYEDGHQDMRHAMMVLLSEGIEVNSSGNLRVAVVEGATPVKVRYRSLNDASDTHQQLTHRCSDNHYRFNFYLGHGLVDL